MERRTFLKTVAAGLARRWSATAAEAFEQPRPARASGKRVIVAGAGITGLCCAYELMQRGIDVTVLEASGRYGGHVFTGHDGLSDGLWADYGADHLTSQATSNSSATSMRSGSKRSPIPMRKARHCPPTTAS